MGASYLFPIYILFLRQGLIAINFHCSVPLIVKKYHNLHVRFVLFATYLWGNPVGEYCTLSLHLYDFIIVLQYTFSDPGL